MSPGLRILPVSDGALFRKQIHEEMARIDYDKSGTIEFQEFVLLMKKARLVHFLPCLYIPGSVVSGSIMEFCGMRYDSCNRSEGRAAVWWMKFPRTSSRGKGFSC